MAANTNPVLGVVILMRHGDRQGFYQDPNTYTASHTTITPLGEQQTFQLGQLLKSRYLNTSSPNVIPSLSTVTNSGQFSGTAFTVQADNGGEGGVILDSTTAAFQGLFPPSTTTSNTTLANGQVIVSPLGGYQYVGVESINPNTNISFEPWTQCPAFDQWTQQVYASNSFTQKASQSQTWLQTLSSIVSPRPVTLTNVYNVFDYLNVESIHNATVAAQINVSTLAQVRDLANFHEHALFTDPSLDGIGNLAGRTLLPQIVSTLNSFTNSSVPSRMTFLGAAYKPFLSIANMTAIENQAYGMVNYAAAFAFEVRAATTNSTGSSGFEVRLSFKNGTDDPDFRPLTMFGSSTVDMSLDEFTSRLEPHLLPTLEDWCKACDNTQTRGCDTVHEALRATGGSVTTTYGHHDVSPLAAGFIGVAVTLVLAATVLGLLTLLGCIGLTATSRRRRQQPHRQSLTSVMPPTKADEMNSQSSASMEKSTSR